MYLLIYHTAKFICEYTIHTNPSHRAAHPLFVVYFLPIFTFYSHIHDETDPDHHAVWRSIALDKVKEPPSQEVQRCFCPCSIFHKDGI